MQSVTRFSVGFAMELAFRSSRPSKVLQVTFRAPARLGAEAPEKTRCYGQD